EAYAFGL
uniref:Carcinustatin-2 n=1 Tax=Carcinus maenas TaxID=6759 RepID=ALL2_CARMA|nr:RecName: Full=Carcinustatin-2 [Carcinus maenas]